MIRPSLPVAILAALVSFGCQRAAEPEVVTPSGTAEQSSAYVTPKSIAFRLADADEQIQPIEERTVVAGLPLTDAEAAQVLARLPKLAEDGAGDAQEFSLPPHSLPAPQPGTTFELASPLKEEPPPVEVTTTGPLEVERFAPEGAVPIVPNVSLTFSQPIVPMMPSEALSDEAVPVRLSPQPAGAWYWMGTRTLVFKPKERLPMATTYTVTVPAGLKSTSGGVLTKELRWTFTTPAPTVTRWIPRYDTVGFEPVIFAAFDQVIDPEAMLGKVRLRVRGRKASFRRATQEEVEADDRVRAAAERAGEGRWLAIVPKRRLPVGAQVNVRIVKGTKGLEGPLGTTEEQVNDFATFDRLKLRHALCGRGNECTPPSSFQLEFSNELDPARFDPKMVTISPELPGMKVEVAGKRIFVRGPTKGNTSYTLKIDAGLADVHGQTLNQPATATIEMWPAAPYLAPAGREVVVIDPSGPLEYVAHTINEPWLLAQVYAVTPEDWSAYASWHLRWRRGDGGSPPGRLVLDELIPTREAPEELVGTAIDLSAAMDGGVGHAVVHISSGNESRKYGRRREVIVWVQATKLGLHAFFEADRATAWVSRFADGAPLDEVEVSLVGSDASALTKDGLAMLPLTQGAHPLVAKMGDDSTFLLAGTYVADSFWQSKQEWTSRWFVFDDRGIYRPGEEVHIKGWVRRDDLTLGGGLALERPADRRAAVEYHVTDPRGAGLVSGQVPLSPQGSFDLSFTIPASANLGKAKLRLVPIGLRGASGAEHSFEVAEFRKPEFLVKTNLSEGPHFVGEHAVATVDATYYAGGGLPDAPVEWTVEQTSASFTPPNRGDFHFGPAHATLWQRMLRTREVEERATWSSRTDAGGSHRLRVNFDAREPAYPFRLALTPSVEDLNRQRWSGRASMLVHPSKQYVGLRLAKNFIRAGERLEVELVVADLDGALLASRPVEVRSERIGTVRRGAGYVDEEQDVQRCRVESSAGDVPPARCSLVADEGGRYRVTAVVVDEEGRRNESSLIAWVLGGARPMSRGLDADKATLVLDKSEYQPGETATVLVISPFAPAEGVLTVRRQGLVHLERFRMEETSRTLQVKLDDSMVPNVEVDVALVGASLRVGTDGNEDPSLPRRPAHASGSAALKILPSTRTLSVWATAKESKLSPGGSTIIDVEVRDPKGRPAKGAEVAVVVVDEAVLALTGYETPSPLAAFYPNRRMDVWERQSRGNVVLGSPLAELGQAEIRGDDKRRGRFGTFGLGGPVDFGPGGFGGGQGVTGPGQGALGLGGLGTKGGRQGSGAQGLGERRAASRGMFGVRGDADIEEGAAFDDDTPITQRWNFAPLALFAPRVRTDGDGKARVPVKLPDNLTRYRVMAVASVGVDFFGSAESTITARLPLMVRPSAPRFLNVGDAFDLSVLIQNQTDEPVDVAIVVEATNAALEEGAKRLTLPANDRVEVRFPTTTQKAGKARFQFGVVGPGFADASQVELPVYTPATTEAFASYGVIDSGAIAQQVRLPEEVFPQVGGLEVSTSSTQLQTLTDALIYLSNYPYDCSEQLASRVLALAALRDVLTAFGAEGLPAPEELQAKVTADLEQLARTQRDDGGWAFWPGLSETWPHVSIHVAHALVRAKEKGYSPGPKTLERAMNYLRDIEKNTPGWYGPDAARSLSAYALYVRARNGDADPTKALQLIDEAGGVDLLPLEALGWIWPTLSASGEHEDVVEAIRRHVDNRVAETAGAAHFVTSYGDRAWLVLHSNRRTDGVLLEALIGDQPDSALIPKLVKGLLAHRTSGRWRSTQENAFVLLALDRYFHVYEETTPDFVARMWLDDRFAGEHAFRGRGADQSELRVPMSWLAANAADARELILAKDGPGRLYYRIGMQYAPTDLNLPPIDRGFVVSRSYEGVDRPEDVSRDEEGAWRIRLGARVRVRLSMVATGRRYHVALVDPLPAGLEPLNPALAVSGALPTDLGADDAARGLSWWGWLWNRTWYEHQNLRDHRAEAFASRVYGGVWDYSYVATATTPGTFIAPPPKAEEMYAPETFGRGASDWVIVEGAPSVATAGE